MDEYLEDPKKNIVLAFAERHPYILLIVIAVLLVLLAFSFFKGPRSVCKKKKTVKLEDDDDMDELIEQIHIKQKKKNCD